MQISSILSSNLHSNVSRSTRINSSSVHTYIFVCFTLRVFLQGFVTQKCNRWYPSMPCSRSPGGAIPACIAGGIPACLAAGLQGGEGGAIPACIVGGIPACLAGGLGGGGACSREVCCGGREVCSQEGCLVETPGMATAAGGTHPTGMHSCRVLNL